MRCTVPSRTGPACFEYDRMFLAYLYLLTTSSSQCNEMACGKVVGDLYEPVTRYIAGAGAGEVHRLMADARRGRSLAACLAARESVDESLCVVVESCSDGPPASEGRPPPAQLSCAAHLLYHRFLHSHEYLVNIVRLMSEALRGG